MGSPTTTNCLARAKEPKASWGRIWEASSITIRSKSIPSGLRYCATDIGLIIKHGFKVEIDLPALLSNGLTGIWALFFANSFSNKPISVNLLFAPVITPLGGLFLEALYAIFFHCNLINSLSHFLNCVSMLSCSIPLNSFRDSCLDIISSANWW